VKIGILSLVGGLMGLLSISNAQCLDALSSPAINASLYSEGAIRKFEKQFDAWTTRCEEIAQLKYRVCNLLAGAYDAKGERRGTILLATDDAGKPTVLISINPPVRVSMPIAVETAFTTKSRKRLVRVAYKNEFSAILCDAACKYMFPADQRLIFALNDGNVVKILFHGAERGVKSPLHPEVRDAAIELTVQGRGFARALQASLANWSSTSNQESATTTVIRGVAQLRPRKEE
jgi:hypothetical protein